MRRRAFISGALALVAAQPALAQPMLPLHDKPRRFGSPPFVDSAGRNLTLDDFRGRVVLANVWATWCPPCREEMPTLDRLQGRLGGSHFHVLPLSIDRAGLPPVRRFYDEIGVQNLGIYLADEVRAMLAFAVVGLPTTVLVDRDGRELGRLTGPAEWDSAPNLALFEDVIARRI